MSGGHWDYLSFRLEERAGYAGNVWKLLGAIEHALDWGICADTCLDCARLRVAHGLEAYFDTEATNETSAIRLIRSTEPECEECKTREHISSVVHHHPAVIYRHPKDGLSLTFVDARGKEYTGIVFPVDGEE